MPGKFIAIEGLDGCGSTTQIRRLGEHFSTWHTTAEPSKGPVGLLIREALRNEIDLADSVLPYLFAADRKDHLEREIEPALAKGQWVVTDRYYGSSMAYQALIAPLDRIVALNRDFRSPDLTLYLDISPEQALARIEARGEAIERFETLEHLREIDSGFGIALALLAERGERIERIDATGTPDEVHARILETLAKCLP